MSDNSQSFSSSTFPLLATVYALPSLLEAKVPPEYLAGAISAKDPELLDNLTGKKADKMAKLWAPLIVHNIFYGLVDRFESRVLFETLERAEAILQKAAGSPWSNAFRVAGEQGMAPSVYIQRQQIAGKESLLASKSNWERVAAGVQSELASWIVQSAAILKAAFKELETENSQVSLKKLSKFSLKGAC